LPVTGQEQVNRLFELTQQKLLMKMT
jgi:hypothetical protein